jgi:hypothetical protein
MARHTDDDRPYVTLDEFDLAVESMRGRPDTVDCETTLHLCEPITGRKAMTYIVRHFRTSGEGDTLFLTVVAGEQAKKIILPPKVMAVLNRQDATLTTKLRRRQGKRQADERKARGIQPAFLKKAGGE